MGPRASRRLGFQSSLRDNVTEDKQFVPPGSAETTFTVVPGEADWVAQMIALQMITLK
jgi:hypothetical protein